MDNFEAFDETFNSFIQYPEENTEHLDFQLPAMDTSAEALQFSDMELFPEMDSSQYDFSFNLFEASQCPLVDITYENPFIAEVASLAPQADDFRHVVDSWAAADHRLRSAKQKRRDAALDLHLQRFMSAHSDTEQFSADSDYSPSVACSQASSQRSPVDSTPPSSTATSNSESPAAAQSAGRELIFDMNLNTATQLPKKQKKRTKAQIEDYINARRNGACTKHKKQHKKCNCHEKLSPKSVMDTVDVNAKRRRVAAVPDKAILTPELVSNNSLSPVSVSPLSRSSLDTVPLVHDTGIALPGVEGLHGLDPLLELDTPLPIDAVLKEQYIPKETAGFVSSLERHLVNAPESSNRSGHDQRSDRHSTAHYIAPESRSLQGASSAAPSTPADRQNGLALISSTTSNLQVNGPLDALSDLPGHYSYSRRLRRGIEESDTNTTVTPALPPASRLGASSGQGLLDTAPSTRVSSASLVTPASTLPGVERLVQTPSTLQVSTAMPLPRALPTTLNELVLANVDSLIFAKALQTAYLAAMQQDQSDLTALMATAGLMSQLANMVLQTLQLMIAFRPSLFQFLSEQIRQQCGSEQSSGVPDLPFYPASARLIGSC